MREIEIAGAFRPALEPAEPINDSAVGPASQVAERIAIVIIPIQQRGQPELAQVVRALRAAGFLFGPLESGQQETGENGQNGYYN